MLVYLADDSVVPLAVENLPSFSAHELHRAIREVLQLPDIALDAFALWLVSPLLGKARLRSQGGKVGKVLTSCGATVHQGKVGLVCGLELSTLLRTQSP